jgi:hemolysin activation/secretion protein
MKFSVCIASLGAVSALLTVTSAALGQTPAIIPSVPYGAGNALQQANEARREAPPRAKAVPALPQLNEPLLTIDDKTTLFIRGFVVEGPSLVDEAEVRAILVTYEKRKLTLAQIYEAADKITALYREAGYLYAKAYVPAQDARSGLLTIKLLPGQYGAITVKNESLVGNDYLRGVIDHALGNPAPDGASPLIHNDELDRALSLMSDLAGAGTPRAATEAGKQPGTSDFIFNVPEGRRVDGYVLADNYGPGFTGRDRLSAGLDINSPLGFGDRISGFGLISDQTELVSGRVAYAFPLGYDGLRGEIAGLRTIYTLGGIYSGLDATGTANSGTATLTYAIRRSREDSIYVSGTFTHKGIDDKAFGTSLADRTVDSGTVAISRDTAGTMPFFNLPMTTSASLSFTAGYVNYADPAQKLANVTGANSAGDYQKINLSFSSIIAFDDKWSLTTSLKAQKSFSGNLDSSEQMVLTGSFGVRSYDEGLAGDSGYLMTPEIKYALPEIMGYRHTVGLFTDVGAAWLENASYTVLQRSFTPLYDVGFGYYGNYEYSPGRTLFLKAQVAHTYAEDKGAPTSTTYDLHTKGLVQVGMSF